MIITVEHTDSTNRLARALVDQGEFQEGLVIQALTQSGGRGQKGRSFASPAGGLYFSLLLRPDLPLETIALTTLATGLACQEILSQRCGIDPQIKWPNDLYLAGKKLAGILCENLLTQEDGVTTATVIIGVGLNVHTPMTAFAPELRPLVTTLAEHKTNPIELAELLELLVPAIITTINQLKSDCAGILARWQQHDYLLNKPIVYHNEASLLKGIGAGVTTQGYYRLRDTLGQEHHLLGGQLRPDW